MPRAIVIKGGKARSFEKIHELVKRGSPEEVRRGLSESDKMDILFDSKHDPERQRISGTLAVKLPHDEVIRLQRRAKGEPE